MRIKLILFFMFFTSMLFSKKLKEGTYRGVLILDESQHLELPFNFEVKYFHKNPQIIIRNADEKIVVDEIMVKKDSVFFKMPVFDTEFRCIITSAGWDGLWINHYRKEKNKIKFRATFDKRSRFDFDPGRFDPALEGKWEVTFSPQAKDSSKAIGLFHHLEQSNYLSGTFLTETGDYRYLEGMFHQNKMYLSCFDGSHAFLFVAELSNEQTLKGKFYSGVHWQEDWTAVRNEKFQLKDPEQITVAYNKDEIINFSFSDLNGKKVALSDSEFLNKPVIIQIMGSWCPNCMDETRYLSELYQKQEQQGLEIVALAFEKTSDFEKAKTQVERMKARLNVPYTILITQQSGKEKAGEVLPFLNKISAFPTTLFLNRAHQIVKTHSGFSGPATGKAYEEFKQQCEQLISRLLKE